MTDARPSASDWEQAVEEAKARWPKEWDHDRLDEDNYHAEGYQMAVRDIEREARRIAGERMSNGEANGG